MLEGHAPLDRGEGERLEVHREELAEAAALGLLDQVQPRRLRTRLGPAEVSDGLTGPSQGENVSKTKIA